MIEEVLGLVADLSKMPIEEVKSTFLKENDTLDFKEINEVLKTKIARERDEKADSKFKEAEKRTAEKLEAVIREIYAIDDKNIKGEELIRKGFEKVTSGKEINEVDVIKHPKYMALRGEVENAYKTQLDEVTVKYNSLLNEISEEKKFSKFSEVFNQTVSKLKPVIAGDEDKRQFQLSNIQTIAYKSYKWGEKDGDTIAFKENGEPVIQPNGSFLKMESLVESIIRKGFALEDEVKQDHFTKAKLPSNGSQDEIQRAVNSLNSREELDKLYLETSDSKIKSAIVKRKRELKIF